MADEGFSIDRPAEAGNLNMACFAISRALDQLEFTIPEAAVMARRLLRVAGRLIIDTAAPGADPATWENTETQALQWLREAVEAVGYDITPRAGSGRPQIPHPLEGWVE